MRGLWKEALDDPKTVKLIIEKLRAATTTTKSVVPALESAARINREIGLGSDMPAGGVQINIYSNIRRGKLK